MPRTIVSLFVALALASGTLVRAAAELPPLQEAKALSDAGWAAIGLQQYERARELFGRAIRLDPGNKENELLVVQLEQELGNHDAAMDALAKHLRQGPGVWSSAEQTIHQVVRNARSSSQSRLDLLQLLFDSQWQPTLQGPSEAWYKLAQERVLRGDADAARAAIARISAPHMLVRIRSDKRFDGLYDPDSEQFDVAAAASRKVDDLHVQAILHPTKLHLLVDLTRAMLAVGMNKEIVELSEELLKWLQSADNAAAFGDIDQRLWIMNNRSTALANLGRTEEALDVLQKAAALDFEGRPNVNQILNLANFYCALGRGEDALSAAAKTGETMNNYGRMVQAWTRHCGSVLTGDQAGASRALTYLREHRADNQAVYMLALLRSNQLDEAANTVIERLGAESTRDDMLYEMQDFLEDKPLPAAVELNARWKVVLAREDVQLALAKVGRTQHYDYFGN